eukprot:SM000145S00808  [mRNA]  locus=s145:342543:346600:+ [translate_table: standard]
MPAAASDTDFRRALRAEFEATAAAPAAAVGGAVAGGARLAAVAPGGVLHPKLRTKKGRATVSPAAAARNLDSKDAVAADLAASARLQHCLLATRVRQWCRCEWFYAAVDAPWFARNEFAEYLEHAALGHAARLTRAEWGVIRRSGYARHLCSYHQRLQAAAALTPAVRDVSRSSLGKPRRLSRGFLREEREKLGVYREAARSAHHQEQHRRGGLKAAAADNVPAAEVAAEDLARPLVVGQRVAALHPRARAVHDGSVLTVDRGRCRVQFDRPHLGVEHVKDMDVMPLDPLENLPEMMQRQWLAAARDRTAAGSEERSCGGSGAVDAGSQRPAPSNGGAAARAALNEWLEMPPPAPPPPLVPPPLAAAAGGSTTMAASWPRQQHSQLLVASLTKRNSDTVDSVSTARVAANAAAAAAQSLAAQGLTPAQARAREADTRALVDLARALDKKEAMLVELRRMNEEAEERSPAAGGDAEGSERQAAAASAADGALAVQPRSEAFQRQYAALVLQLKDVNKQVEGALLRLRQQNRGAEVGQGPAALGDSPVSAARHPPIGEMAAAARRHARAMVAAAIQAIAGLQEGEDWGPALDQALQSMVGAGPRGQAQDGAAAARPAPEQAADGTAETFCSGQAGKDAPQLETGLTTDEPHRSGKAGGSSRRPPIVPVDPLISVQELAQQSLGLGGGGGDGGGGAYGREAGMLSELMASCVATLLMIQDCAERQLPQADVTLTLDSALSSLRPHSVQNQRAFWEIEQSIAVIKTQIVSQLPADMHFG